MMKRMTKQQKACLLIFFVGRLAVLMGCASDATPSKPSESTMLSSSENVNYSDSNTPNSEDKDDETPHNSEIAEVANNDVILFVYGSWNEGVKGEDTEYILSSEDAEIITDLFYVHEKEIHSTPCDCIDDFTFQIGTDRLGTTESLGTLCGSIGGEFVTISLSEDENEALRELISQYEQDVQE